MTELDELLLDVVGRCSTWPQRMHEFRNVLKRRDAEKAAKVVLTLEQMQTRFKELCQVVPRGNTTAMSWNSSRLKLLKTVDENTAGESHEAKTVVFNGGVKEKGWTFVATLEQVKAKLEWLARRREHDKPPARTTRKKRTEERGGSSKKAPASRQRKPKRQRVGADVATGTAPLAWAPSGASSTEDGDAECDLGLINGFDCSVPESDDSDAEDGSGVSGVFTSNASLLGSEPASSTSGGLHGATGRRNSTSGSEVSQNDSTPNASTGTQEAEVVEQRAANGPGELEIAGKDTMAVHLRWLLNKQLMSDVTFIVEGTEVFAHKCLCARYDYFKTLFSVDNCPRRIEVVDVSRPTFLSLLEYVYTDRVTVSSDRVKELLVVAGRFGVEDLKECCGEQLLKSLCADNAASLLSAAIHLSDPWLREKCFSFTLQNLEKVSKTRSFHEMAKSHPEVLVEIVQKLSTLVYFT